MTFAEKPESDMIRRQVAALRDALWLGARGWWPDFLFHFADLRNVVSILQAGALLSRSEIMAQQAHFTDAASHEVLGWTDDEWKQYARFYFRPRTPMLYRNEGFRPRERQWQGAHCPVPVYLLFDLEAILCRADSRFSNGNLANTASEFVEVDIFDTAADFEKLPFELIYHDSRVPPEERRKIISHRHAEVIVPKAVDLDYLRLIWCRSQAEYETLRFLLPDTLWQRWRDKITARTDYNLFNREWVHVEQATLTSTRMIFRFNPCRKPEDAGWFNLRGEVKDSATGRTHQWETRDVQINQRLEVELPYRSREYTVHLYVDDHLAYASRYQEDNLPF
jgi:hypothetical protein